MRSSGSTIAKGNRVFFYSTRLLVVSEEIIDLFSSIKQSSIAVNMDLADSLSSVDLEELLAVAQHIQHWFL